MAEENYNALVVSGLPGSGKSTLTKKVSELTGWSIYSIGGKFREKLKELQETGQVSRDITIKEYWPTVSDEEQIKVNRDLLELVNKGNIIADTRYAQYLKQTTAKPFFLFLTADVSRRAHRSQFTENEDYMGKTIKEIKEILLQREKDEVDIGQRIFGFDYRNPEDYNLILNNTIVPVEKEVGIVLRALGKNAP